MKSVLTLLFSTLLAATSLAAMPQNNNTVETRRQQLKDLLAEQWEYTLRTNPEYASILGDLRYNDRLDDYSVAHILADLEQKRAFLRRFEAVDTTGLPDQEQLDKTLMVRRLREEIEEAQFKPWEMPVNQFIGLHIDLPVTASLFRFQTTKDYEDYVARLHQVPKAFADVAERMRLGMNDGLMPPRFLLEKVAVQADGIAAKTGDASPFAHPVLQFPPTVPQADRKRLHDAVIAAIQTEVAPAYTRFARFVREEYAPKGRTEPGLWSLPDGDRRYAFAVRHMTTTDMTPAQIHELGLRQVAEIEGEMLAIAHRLGYKDLASFNEHVKTDRTLYASSREQILDLYRRYTDQMYGQLPKLFGRMPKAPVEVAPVEAFREKEAAGAQYYTGTPDGSRPGRVVVNTSDFEHRSLLNIESTAYHEGVPGHHMQLSIAQEIPTLPPFRQHAHYGAYIEGWALYTERLGKEVGYYQDPYSDYGRLENEMLRAIRLVVDTGVHYRHWSRQQMVDFFHQHSAIDEPSVQAETDRYIAWPAQALGYKVGQLKFLELRERAKRQLGDRFDIRAFHDEMIGSGALPLDVLDERTNAWIAGQKSSGATSRAR